MATTSVPRRPHTEDVACRLGELRIVLSLALNNMSTTELAGDALSVIALALRVIEAAIDDLSPVPVAGAA